MRLINNLYPIVFLSKNATMRRSSIVYFPKNNILSNKKISTFSFGGALNTNLMYEMSPFFDKTKQIISLSDIKNSTITLKNTSGNAILENVSFEYISSLRGELIEINDFIDWSESYITVNNASTPGLSYYYLLFYVTYDDIYSSRPIIKKTITKNALCFSNNLYNKYYPTPLASVINGDFGRLVGVRLSKPYIVKKEHSSNPGNVSIKLNLYDKSGRNFGPIILDSFCVYSYGNNYNEVANILPLMPRNIDNILYFNYIDLDYNRSTIEFDFQTIGNLNPNITFLFS